MRLRKKHYRESLRTHREYSVLFATEALIKRSRTALEFSDRELEAGRRIAWTDIADTVANWIAVSFVGASAVAVIFIIVWFIYFCLTTHA